MGVVRAKELSPLLCSVMGNTEQEVFKGQMCPRKKESHFHQNTVLTHLCSFKVTASADFKVSYVCFINE